MALRSDRPRRDIFPSAPAELPERLAEKISAPAAP
jgi:hypothetical protein